MNSLVAVAPVTRLTKVAPVNQVQVSFVENFAAIIEFFGFYDYMNYQLMHLPLIIVCGFWTDFCWVGTAFVASKTALPINYDRMKVLFAHYPAGSSLKCFKHYIQILKSGRFQEYDYGNVMNLRLYGQATPPEIDLSSIGDLGIPIVMTYGKDDTIVYQEDSLWLSNQI